MAVEHTSPLHQFVIERLVPIHIGGVDLSYSNSAVFMSVAVILTTAFMLAATSGSRLVPTRLQSTAELFYEFIAGMVRDNVGSAGRPYFPFIFTLFMFILFGNCIGIVPYSFTFTSHIIVTFALAMFIFVAVTVIAFARHGLHFFKFFVPEGLPWPLVPLLAVIEVISYCIRPFTLSIRLFANMMAGHTMLVIFAGFVVAMGVFGFLPLAFNVAFILLELLVAVLQAYVYTILTCIYLHDAIHMH